MSRHILVYKTEAFMEFVVLLIIVKAFHSLLFFRVDYTSTRGVLHWEFVCDIQP